MIKINLLKNMGGTEGGAGGVSVAITNETLRMVVLKVFATFILIIGLMIYENVNLSEIDDQIKKIQLNVQQVQAEKAKFGDAGPKIELYNKEKIRVDKELEVVRVIARNRLREVKALDAIQSLMPAKAWTKKIVIEGNLVKLDGYTSSDDGVNEIIRALEGSVYFSKVEPKNTSQENRPGGPVKRFELEFRIGKQNEAPK